MYAVCGQGWRLFLAEAIFGPIASGRASNFSLRLQLAKVLPVLIFKSLQTSKYLQLKFRPEVHTLINALQFLLQLVESRQLRYHSTPTTIVQQVPVQTSSSHLSSHCQAPNHCSPERMAGQVSDICSQLQQRPISQEQLLAEVEGIFAGLKMVEAKCMEVDKKLALHIQNGARAKSKLNNKQWQALIALHRTLLYETVPRFTDT